MRNRSYSDEAKYCRGLAADLGEGSEKPFLLKIADAFDDLDGQSFPGPGRVLGPLGEQMTFDKLPPVNTARWTARRKTEVVAAVVGGLLSLDEACKRYSLSKEEFMSWQRALNRNGIRGLRVTHLQDYRD